VAAPVESGERRVAPRLHTADATSKNENDSRFRVSSRG
jgi:hypothetical protein